MIGELLRLLALIATLVCAINLFSWAGDATLSGFWLGLLAVCVFINLMLGDCLNV